jgi:hypothetical protein
MIGGYFYALVLSAVAIIWCLAGILVGLGASFFI